MQNLFFIKACRYTLQMHYIELHIVISVFEDIKTRLAFQVQIIKLLANHKIIRTFQKILFLHRVHPFHLNLWWFKGYILGLVVTPNAMLRHSFRLPSEFVKKNMHSNFFWQSFFLRFQRICTLSGIFLKKNYDIAKKVALTTLKIVSAEAPTVPIFRICHVRKLPLRNSKWARFEQGIYDL